MASQPLWGRSTPKKIHTTHSYIPVTLTRTFEVGYRQLNSKFLKGPNEYFYFVWVCTLFILFCTLSVQIGQIPVIPCNNTRVATQKLTLCPGHCCCSILWLHTNLVSSDSGQGLITSPSNYCAVIHLYTLKLVTPWPWEKLCASENPHPLSTSHFWTTPPYFVLKKNTAVIKKPLFNSKERQRWTLRPCFAMRRSVPRTVPRTRARSYRHARLLSSPGEAAAYRIGPLEKKKNSEIKVRILTFFSEFGGGHLQASRFSNSDGSSCAGGELTHEIWWI